VLLSAGVPFLEGGAEMGRTKGGNHNSYDAGDQVNQYDWRRGRIPYFQETAEYTKGLIEIRRAHPALRMAKAEQVEKHVKVWTGLMSDGVYILEIDGEAVGDSWSDIYLYFNTGAKPVTIRMGGYNLASDGLKAVNGTLRVLQNEETIPPGVAWVLWR
jgi:pullulanase